jgi:XTP/dITP diphosphohydrolase
VSHRLVVATGNSGKLREIQAIVAYSLRRLDLMLVRPVDVGCADWQIAEDRLTFAENAILKAAAAARATGLPALADDSGLCVDALGGEPGVHSARWLGPEAADRDRNDALLGRLDEVGDRSAHFTCAAAVVDPGGRAIVREAICAGAIAPEARGSLGFGYDAIFIPGPAQQTFAEMAPQEKNRISHRTLALRGLVGMKDFNEMFSF